ncbi:riboflavin transporter 2-A like protein [Danaus plexippus plexippus]|uniref:Riboflavin transporter n=1 Tax=Danaus plexippus plexippus TaxID=278856 RepID=A0A212F672_DANPL|nr:riboflavin transporter 2-A like protein [Danaus plexippus plexippus]
MLGARRRIFLDVLMACWGLGTWLGVNGLYVQLPLLVERLPEGWALPSSMTVAIQLANVGLIAYAAMRRLLPRAPDSPYIYILLSVGTLALYLNSFLYTETAVLGEANRSVSFLALTFFAALVGCTSSVLFYPYLRHFRDVYLATYLVGEGLSGFLPSLFALIQGVGGNPECVLSSDNKTMEAVYPPARFNTTVFLILLGCLATVSLVSFSLIDNLSCFLSERSYSCMPYGTSVYHLAVTLGSMANPVACLAGVWLKPVRSRVLAAMLCAALIPLCYIISTALLSPSPPLRAETSGRVLVVLSWVLVCGVLSYGRMWVYGWARRGGATGMRACGAATQLGSAVGSLALFVLVNYSSLFTQPELCPAT